MQQWRVYTITVANPAGPPATQLNPGRPEDHLLTPQAVPTKFAPLPAPSFYITGRQPLRPGAILLAIVAAVSALGAVLYVMSHGGPTSTLGQRGQDDPDQIDVIVVGGPAGAPKPARPGDHPSTVHPTIIVHLPRFGDQVGLIPNTPAGHLLYNWLAAFNQASYPALANALPNVALASATAAQLELRRQTGGLSLLSAKEIEPGLLVFRLRDQTPSATEVLGSLWMRPNSSPATIESFSLRAVPSPGQGAHTGAASP